MRLARHHLAPFLAGLLAACVAARERPDVLAELARAGEAAEALTFRDEGLPLDEEPEPAGRLSLAMAVRLALCASPELQAALARVRVAEAEADQARLLPNPVLDFVLRLEEGGGTRVETSIAGDLFGLLSRPRQASAAEDRLAAAVAEAVTVALDVVAETRTRHAHAWAAEELARAAQVRLELLAQLLEVARVRHAAGQGRAIDVSVLQAEVVALELERDERAAERQRTRFSLARRIGRPSGKADWLLDPCTAPPPEARDERAWIALALERRPEIHSRSFELAALATEAGLARAQVFAGTELGLSLEHDDGTALGPALVVPLPLFDTGSARKRRALARVNEARSELVETRRQVVEEVRVALSDLESARARLARLEERLLPLELERQARIGEAFRASQVDVTAVLLAEQGLHISRERGIELERELCEAWARLERAAGGARSPALE